MAAITRKWSTVLNGNITDFAAFKAETDKIMANIKMKSQPGSANPENEPYEITDAASAYTDMTKQFGMVPTFLKQYPEVGIAGAWKEMKAVQLSSKTALPGRIKELIGIAVSAQIPCQYCSHFHTQAAMLNGAKNFEIQEAIAIAASTRHWSTILNGSQIDEGTFKREVQRIMKHMSTQIKMRSASNN